MKTGLVRTLGVAAVLVGCSSAANAAEAPVPADATVYELPHYTVTNSLVLPEPESWRYATLPGYEVLSSASEAETQRFLREFQTLQQVIDVTWPVLRRGAAPVPTTLILCGRNPSARAFLNPRGRLVGSYDAFEFQQLDPSDANQPGLRVGRVASRFFADEEHACIVVDLADDSSGLADPYRQFANEYVRQLIGRLDAAAPAWLVEGVASLFGGLEHSEKWIAFGDLGGKQDDFNQLLTAKPSAAASSPLDDPAPQGSSDATPPRPLMSAVGALLPLATMLEATEPQLRSDPKLRALARAFVHLCLYGRGQKYQKPLFVYLSRLQGGAGSEALFHECFGLSTAKMLEELQGYAAFTDYRHVQFRAQKGGGLKPPAPVALRAATPAEIGRIKGEGLLLAGNRDAAFIELLAPYVRHQTDNDLLAALALFELRSELSARAQRGRRLLEIATAGGTTRALAYLELARLRRDEVVGPLNAAQREQVVAPLRHAATLAPPLPAVFELCAVVWSEAAEAPPAEDLALLERGVARFPGRLGLVYHTAQLCAAGGRVKQAAKLAEWGERVAREPRDKERFAQLRAALAGAKTGG